MERRKLDDVKTIYSVIIKRTWRSLFALDLQTKDTYMYSNDSTRFSVLVQSKLTPFCNLGQYINQKVKPIIEVGVLCPIIIRPCEGGSS